MKYILWSTFNLKTNTFSFKVNENYTNWLLNIVIYCCKFTKIMSTFHTYFNNVRENNCRTKKKKKDDETAK